MAEQTRAASLPENADDEEDEGVEIPTSRPGMRAVRRRSSSGRRHRTRTNLSDLRFRQIRIALLSVVLISFVYIITPKSLHEQIGHGVKQVLRPFKGIVGALHLEVIALIIAAAILLYLTPGVEDFVLRLLGIRRGGSSARR